MEVGPATAPDQAPAIRAVSPGAQAMAEALAGEIAADWPVVTLGPIPAMLAGAMVQLDLPLEATAVRAVDGTAAKLRVVI
jgi:hypothetical protein